MNKIISGLIVFFSCLFPGSSIAQLEQLNCYLDVGSYHIQLEPDLLTQSLKGSVIIRFSTTKPASEVAFDCGNLTVERVKGRSVKGFRQEDKKLVVYFSRPVKAKQKIQVFYHGSPSRGLVFSAEKQEVYTVYHTSEWSVCHDKPHDKATLRLDLIVPANVKTVASGIRAGRKEAPPHKVMHSWQQKVATPAYAFGFAIGSFNEQSEEQEGITFYYFSGSHTTGELATIFKPSPDMLHFFEEKAGTPYFQPTYSQVLTGSHYQEMAGFAVLRESYGELVLRDSTETNLIGHELAHQWWGNRITCENLEHFWLNEGFATYMSAAYNEHRFGREKYMENINAYYRVYEKIKAKGVDKPLVFADWSSPTADDRNLVYFKGAYVLHLLREELGDDAFWKGIKYYSQQYEGKSVSTRDFQEALERATQKSLKRFFEEWVYS